MSNEVSIFEDNTSLVRMGLDDDTLAVAGSGNNKRISIKGGVFRKMIGGKEIAALEERHMNVIFVKMAHDPSRTFYKDAYKEGVAVSPACWSSNAKTPDEAVEAPIAKSCNDCPMSIKGTGQNGQGTACRLSWRTAVVLPTDPAGDVMQLVLPAASVWGKPESGKWPFRSYIQMLASNNVSAGAVVTKMQFDTKAPSPRVLFSPLSGVREEDHEVIKAQAKSLAAENAVKFTVFKADQDVEVAGVEVAATATIAEPVLREVNPPVAEKDVSDIVKKWSKK